MNILMVLNMQWFISDTETDTLISFIIFIGFRLGLSHFRLRLVSCSWGLLPLLLSVTLSFYWLLR